MENQAMKTTIVGVLTFLGALVTVAIEIFNSGTVSGASISLVVVQLMAVIALFKTKDAA